MDNNSFLTVYLLIFIFWLIVKNQKIFEFQWAGPRFNGSRKCPTKLLGYNLTQIITASLGTSSGDRPQKDRTAPP